MFVPICLDLSILLVLNSREVNLLFRRLDVVLAPPLRWGEELLLHHVTSSKSRWFQASYRDASWAPSIGGFQASSNREDTLGVDVELTGGRMCISHLAWGLGMSQDPTRRRWRV